MSVSYGTDRKPYRNRHILKVHSDEGVADVHSCMGLYVFHGGRIAECFPGCGRKGSASFWLWNNVDDFETKAFRGFGFNYNGSVEVLAALACKFNAFFTSGFVDSAESFFRCLKV